MDAVSNKIQKVGNATGFDSTSGWQQLRFSTRKLETMHKPIERLRRLLERNVQRLDCNQLPSYNGGKTNGGVGNVGSGTFGNVNGGRVPNAAQRRDLEESQESQKVAELYHLVIRCSQALTILRILASNGNHFPRIVQVSKSSEGASIANGAL